MLIENRSGLVVMRSLTECSGTVERESVAEMLEALGGSKRITVGADMAHDIANFVEDLRQIRVTPHVTQKRKGSPIDGRTVRHTSGI